MNAPRAHFAVCLGLVVLSGCREPSEPQLVAAATRSVQDEEPANVLTIDHAVPHVSTVDANKGELVHLFVRERVRNDVGDRPRQVVLMIHGRSVPVLAGAELRYADYDWALWLARSGGFDVFMLDFQGSGRSPRPKMDEPCNLPSSQWALVPVTKATCDAKNPAELYPSVLNTSASDLDELDAVVDYVRDLRGVDKVHLIAWSAGSFRIGPYAASPAGAEKVASLLFYAPIFNAAFRPPPPPLTPMTLTTRTDLLVGDGRTMGWNTEWANQTTCPDQREPGIETVVWSAIMDNDDVGRTWGLPEGVMRVRTVAQSGWDAGVAARINVPTLIIRGELDRGQGGLQQVAQLYDLVQSSNALRPNKLRFTVRCAGHFMLWENRRSVLHQISKEWIKHGRVGGFESGEFIVDLAGNLIPDATP